MKILFHSQAEEELENSFFYYETHQKGLGQKFLDEIEKVLERIKIFLFACGIVEDNVRRCLVNKFPYGVVYFVKDNLIIILAIMHLRKKPNYWKKRKGSSK